MLLVPPELLSYFCPRLSLSVLSVVYYNRILFLVNTFFHEYSLNHFINKNVEKPSFTPQRAFTYNRTTMRVLMLSKALIVGQYQTKAQLLAQCPGVELTVVVPPSWRDERGEMKPERQYTDAYQLLVAPITWNGRYHYHFYPTIGEIIKRIQPDVIHLDEEPYNLATFHALREARRAAPLARSLFFTWQNLKRTYPPPFSWMERYVYRHCDYAIAGNAAAVDVLRGKGFSKPIRVIPQFGVDPEVFSPQSARAASSSAPPLIGMAGRLVPEKGALLLIQALADVRTGWELEILGSGPERARLDTLVQELGLADRVRLIPWCASSEMPAFYRRLAVLVTPSLSRPNWTEQFGRVLVEAMACGVPVIGSSAGEIPNVIGDAGLVFKEGDRAALADALCALLADPGQRETLAQRGRERVLARFTQKTIVDETYAVYQEMCDGQRVGSSNSASVS